MPFAVIKTGGKQYIVAPGKMLKIEKLPAEVGKEVVFDEVLLAGDANELKIGTPTIQDAKVTAEVIEQGRSKKITVLKYKSKTRYRVKRGHRQFYTKVKILAIK